MKSPSKSCNPFLVYCIQINQLNLTIILPEKVVNIMLWAYGKTNKEKLSKNCFQKIFNKDASKMNKMGDIVFMHFSP